MTTLNRLHEIQEIHQAVGRIEGRLVVFEKLVERVSQLEIWQARLKGGWALMAAAWAYICTITHH